MFVFVSGRSSLDLLGTLKWRRDAPEEQLCSAADAAAWFASAGLSLAVDGGRDPVDVERLRAVREALYRTLAAVRAGRRPTRADVTLLNACAGEPGPQLTLTATGAVRRRVTPEQAVGVVVRDAFELFAGADLGKVRDCANPRCTRLFLDLSRAGNRRWCGMTECGNAAKVAAFRARQREDG